jgi:tRNA threonylcarbamoyladenosine biosynthesis protein TsaB
LKLLAIDTSTEACSAALWLDGVVVERFALTPQGHAEHILPMVRTLLAAAELKLAALDALAFGRGPGSFTGIRIGTGVIQGLALGANLPVVPVSSLAALAQGASGHRVLPAIDARMNEVYWGIYERNTTGLVHAVAPERLCPPEQVPIPEGGDWMGVGSGWDRYAPILQRALGNALAGWFEGRYPHAAAIATLGVEGFRSGLAVAAELALPVYLRDEVIKKTGG